MKRVLSTLLTVMMVISMLSCFSVQFAFAQTDPYADLTTAGTTTYANTFVVSPDFDGLLTEGTTLTYWFRGKTYSEVYDANRHFVTFAAAQSAWQARFSDNTVATAVPNYILIGTFSTAFSINYSANLYGANAGISPNDPDFVPSEAAPDAEWAVNSEWSEENATILKKSVTNAFIWTHTDAQQTTIESAGAKPVLTVDGLTYQKHGTGVGDNPNDVLWFQNKGSSHKIEYTANIQNCMLGTRYGVTGHTTQGANFYDVNFKEVRITNYDYNFFWKYLRRVTVDRAYFDSIYINGGSSFLWKPATESLTVNGTTTYNEYYSHGNGGDRNVSWTFTNSMFADFTSSKSIYLAEFTDNCYHDSITFNFDGNLFRDASTATDGLIKFGAYPDASNPTPKITFNNNTFYDTKGDKTSLIAADSSTLMAAYDLTFTNNKVLGYETVYPAFTSDMDSFLGNANWTFSDNYFAKTYTGTADTLGEMPVYNSAGATVLPVEADNPEAWYLDYEMTKTNELLVLGEPNFKNETNLVKYVVDDTVKSVNVAVKLGTGIADLSFAANADGGTTTVYSDAELTTPITEITASQLSSGSVTAYAVVENGDLSRTYSVLVTSRETVDISKYSDPTGTIKEGFGVLLPTEASRVVDSYEIVWQDILYSIPADMAYTTVATARAAGVTQLIMPAGTYSDITIDGTIELYGNHFGVNPNNIPKDRVDDWTKTEAWTVNNSAVTGQIIVAASAAGADIVIDGIEMCSRFTDTAREFGSKKTDITLKNILVTVSSYVYQYNFNLQNANANNTKDIFYTNTDSFALVDSRVEYAITNSNFRMFAAYVPADFTIKGTYFANQYPFLGFFRQSKTTKEGSINLIDNYFDTYSANVGNSSAQFIGSGENKDLVEYGHTAVLNICGNVVIDGINGMFDIMKDCFTTVNFNDNTIISTTNSYNGVMRIANSMVSQYGSDDADYSDRLNISGNRTIGASQYITYSSGTKSANVVGGNYHAPYTADFKNGVNGGKMFGVLDGKDYYLDYNKTVLASDYNIKLGAGMFANNDSKKASLVINGDYVPNLTNEAGDIAYTVYSDKNCKYAVSTIKASDVKGVKKYYAKGEKNGTSFVYELYVTTGNPEAAAYTGDAYLLSDVAGELPVGAKFTATVDGNEYMFTVGQNAYGSVSQITYAHAKAGKTSVPDVIMAEGAHKGGYKVTGNINVTGSATVLKKDFDTSAVKIATIGDSVTEGTGHGDGYTYPEHLQMMLDNTYGSGKYTVKNFGKGNSSATPVNITKDAGYNSSRNHYMRGSWYYSALDYNPDVVIIMIGYNDTSEVYMGGKVYEENLRQLIESVRALPSHPQIVLSGTHYTYASTIREHRIEYVISGIQKKLANEYGAYFVDNDSATKGLVKADYYADSVHLLSSGYEVMARNIKETTEALYSSQRTVTKQGITIDANAQVTEKSKIKVAAIGDDVSYGVSAYYGYYKPLNDILGDGYEVRNYAEPKGTVVAGDKCFKTYDSFYADIGDYQASLAWKPDIAVFSFGKNDTADAAFVTAYTALIKEYEALGTEIYVTTVLNTAVNDLIKTMAADNGWTLIDLYSEVSGLASSYFLSSKTLFSEAGSDAAAEVIAFALAEEFATSYVDPYGQISNDAVVVDYTITEAPAANTVLTYKWDDSAYTFKYGVNAFANINDAIAADADGKLQVIIPANDIATGGAAFSIADTTAAKNVTSIEVFGVNRNIDPNDKSASATDPTADWTLNSAWGAKGESAVGRIEILTTGDNTLKGDLTFNGITMRANYVDTVRSAGTAQDMRNLHTTFKNVIVKTTASVGTTHLINDHCSARRGTTTHGDALSFINFRVEKYQCGTTARFFASSGSLNSAFNTLDNFYINSATAPLNQMGWIHGAAGYANSAAVVKNSQFRGLGKFYIAPSQDGQTNEVATVEVTNNVFYNTSGFAITLCPGFYSTAAVEENYFVDSSTTSTPIKVQKVAEGYSLKNNVFVVKDPANTFAGGNAMSATAPEGSVDMTGCYVAVYTDDYVNGSVAISPETLGTSYSADYYYVDFDRKIKVTDVTVTDVAYSNKVTNLIIDNEGKTITADVGKATVLDNLGVICENSNITSKFFVGEDEVKSLDFTDITEAVNGTVKLYANTTVIATYSVTLTPVDAKLFTSRNDSDEVIKNTAVAVISGVSGLSAGTKVCAIWQGEPYTFIVGTNAFATVEDALASSNATQVIVPAGEIGAVTITRGVTIYGENYNVFPWTIKNGEVIAHSDWGKYGVSTVANITIAAGVTGSTVKVMGVDITGRVIDTARAVSNAKTDITLENTVLYKNPTREFDLRNANNKNTDTAYTNIDSFTIKNMFFINNAPNTDAAFFQEGQPAYFTIDGFGCNDNMQSFGFPKWWPGVKAGEMKLTNSYIKGNYATSSKFDPLIYFSGHTSNTYTAQERGSMPLKLTVTNNTLVDCSAPVTSLSSTTGTTLGVLEIYPGAYKNIEISNNAFISPNDDSTKVISWTGHTAIALNDQDFADRIVFNRNRVVGYLASVHVNNLTELDLSGNFFETPLGLYQVGAPGDTPADTDADTYLDFNLTVKRSDMIPQSDTLGIKALMPIDTLYGYSAGDINSFDFTNDKGATYKVYSDADCTNEITSLDVTVGSASKAYVKATKGSVSLVYTLYVMGVKDAKDVEKATAIADIDNATLWYPSLYGAPNGIEVVSYYDGKAVKYTTGKNVATSAAQIAMFGDNVAFPDDVTNIELELITEANIYSAVADISGVTMRKAKIACVGDSITAGSTTEETYAGEFGYPAIMQSVLGTDGFEVMNFGQSGRTVTSTANFKNGEERSFKLSSAKYGQSISYNGDIVIIGLGTNDVNWAFWTSNDEYITKYVELIRDYQALPSKPAIYITTATARYDGTTLITARVAENLRHIQRVVADITGAQIIDNYNLMSDLFSSSGTSYSNDKIHPNKAGYALYGQRVAAEISDTLTSIAGGTVSVNGGKVTGTISSTATDVDVNLNEVTIDTASPVIDPANVTSVKLHKVTALKNGNSVDSIVATELINDANAVLTGADSIVLSSKTDKDYTVTVSEKEILVTVDGAEEASNETTGEKYATLEDALDAAQNGDTIKLLEDAELRYVTVGEGVTLDINGHKLTADYVTGFDDSNIVDNNVTEDSGLYVDKKHFLVSENNAQLPIYDSENGCYMFTSVSLDYTYYEDSNYYFGPEPPELDTVEGARVNALLREGSENTGVQIIVHLDWETDDYYSTQDFTYKSNYVDEYFTMANSDGHYQNVYFYARFMGDALKQADTVTVTTIVQSDRGAQFVSAPTEFSLK